MTGKGVLENGSVGALVLIAPAALLIIVLFKAWPVIVVVLVLSILFKLWQQQQWQQWSSQVNPDFNRLIQDNRGCITPMDLSLKTSMSGKAAQRFLERKAEEFGAQKKEIEDKGTVYYFLTTSALGSIFDDSEPRQDEETTATATKTRLPSSSLTKIAKLLEEPEADETTAQVNQPASEPTVSIREIAQIHQEAEPIIENTAPEETTESTVDEPTPIEPELEPEPEPELEPEPEPELEPEPEALVTEPSTPLPEENQPPSEVDSTTENHTIVLNQTELAKRLDLHPTTISKHKLDADFDIWSQSKDPEGIAWQYIEETKEFIPV